MCWGFFSSFKCIIMFFQSVLKAASGGSLNILPTVLLWDGALLFCSYLVHSRHLPSMALKTFCSLHHLLALITVTSACHIQSPGGAGDPEAVSIPSVGRGKLSLPLRWGSGWLGSPWFLWWHEHWGAWRVPKFPSPMYRLGGKNWPFLVLLWFWGENVSGDNCLLWPASSVCAQEQFSWWRWKRGSSFLLALLFGITKACIFVQLKWIV